MSYDEQELLKNEYKDDLDFASFTSDEWVDDENGDYSDYSEDDECGRNKSERILHVIEVLLFAVLFIYIVFKIYAVVREDSHEPQVSIEDDIPQVEDSMENDIPQVEDGIIITNNVLYHNLIPGKTYSITSKLIDKKTGEEIKSQMVDADGKTIEKFTFTADKKDGYVVLYFKVNTDDLKNKETIIFESVQ